jgi:hypothetical protein
LFSHHNPLCRKEASSFSQSSRHSVEHQRPPSASGSPQ